MISKSLAILMGCLLLTSLALAGSVGATQRTVLMEMFTNCG
jgi:hypothetical protein